MRLKNDSLTEVATRGVLWKKGDLIKFAKFNGKHLRQSRFFNKVAGLQARNFIKKETLVQTFPVNFANFLRTSFLQNTFGRLLLFLMFAWLSF